MKNLFFLAVFVIMHTLSNAQDGNDSYKPVYPKTSNVQKAGGGLTGQYTIGGVTPDYATFSAAFADLETQGVGGPVEFIVRAGIYTEKPILNVIPGVSSDNNVVFHSETNDSASVVLSWVSSAVSDSNFTMLINGADHVTFSHLTFERTGGDSYSTVVEIANEAIGVSFLNNRFIGPAAFTTTNTTGTRSGIFSSINASNDSLVVRNNIFIDNANGVWINGNSTSTSLYAKGNIIENNIFQNFYVGIFLLYQDAPNIHNNLITRNDASATNDFFGISIRYCVGTMLISKNKISTLGGSYGIRLRSCNGFFAAPAKTYNNFVHNADGSLGRGISVEENSVHHMIVHNSVNYDGTNTTGRAMFVDGSGTGNIKLFNNIFSNSGGGYSIYVTTAASTGVSESNNNCFYSTGTYLGYWSGNKTTLAQIQFTSGKDAASVTGNPNFFTSTDLHVAVSFLNEAGSPLAGITDDIDGELRNLATPDIGADEFLPSAVLEAGKSPVSVYPNPFRTDAMFVLSDKGEYIFTLTDMKGKELRKTVIKERYILNRTGLRSGIYLYSIMPADKNSGEVWHGKIEVTD